MFHSCRVFRKAPERDWHEGLWQVLKSFNIDEGLAQAIQVLHNSSRAVLMNSQLGEFYKTTVGVRQGCLLSPILFSLFLEEIMRETFHDHHTSISIGGRPTYNLCFADDIDLMVSFKTSPTDS